MSTAMHKCPIHITGIYAKTSCESSDCSTSPHSSRQRHESVMLSITTTAAAAAITTTTTTNTNTTTIRHFCFCLIQVWGILKRKPL